MGKRTEMVPIVNNNRYNTLLTGLDLARVITEDYPPEAYRITTQPASAFSVAPNTTITPAEQVLSLALEIANWLLEEDK